MDLYALIYLGMLIAGIALLLLTAFIGEVADFFDGGDASGDGPGWFSGTLIGVFLTAFGGTGLTVRWLKLDVILSLIVAVLAAIIIAVIVRQFILKPLMRQQGNSLVKLTDYVGQTARVTLKVAPGEWGEVRFIDPSGASVSMRAVTQGDVVLHAGQGVIIKNVDGQQVVVEAENNMEGNK